MPEGENGLPILTFASLEAWEAWLHAEHATSRGLWLKLAKKGADVECVAKAEAVDAALCFGWIDGQLQSFDECFWLTRFTPRQPTSKWSRANRERAVQLIAAHRMRPAGIRQIERAKADGRWDAAYESQSRATVPDDLMQALDRTPAALALFEALDSANRYAILYRVTNAKSPATRCAWIERLVAMLARGETIHPRRAKSARTPRRSEPKAE